MSRTHRVTLYAISAVPVLVGMLLVQFSEPFPDGWLDPGEDHYVANLVRAVTFLLGGVALGMIAYTMARSISAETTVTGGHPRVKLYNHVTLIALSNGLFMVALLFYVRERIDQPLSAATPVAFVGLVANIVALGLMLGYQNSRLRKFHSAKQVLATISPTDGATGRPHLSMRIFGSEEQMNVEQWLDSFDTGELVRLTVEKVEEHGDGGKSWMTSRRRKQ